MSACPPFSALSTLIFCALAGGHTLGVSCTGLPHSPLEDGGSCRLLVFLNLWESNQNWKQRESHCHKYFFTPCYRVVWRPAGASWENSCLLRAKLTRRRAASAHQQSTLRRRGRVGTWMHLRHLPEAAGRGAKPHTVGATEHPLVSWTSPLPFAVLPLDSGSTLSLRSGRKRGSSFDGNVKLSPTSCLGHSSPPAMGHRRDGFIIH